MAHNSVSRFERLKKVAESLIHPYSLARSKKHIEFVDKAWPNSQKRKDSSYLSWKFRSKTPEQIENLLLVHDGQNVVGQLGLIPAKVKYSNITYDAQWGCNFKVLKEWEDCGYGSLLDIQSLDKKPITLGASPTKQSEALKIKLGFTELEGPRIMAFPIDFKHFIRLKLPTLSKLAVHLLQVSIRSFYYLRYFKNYQSPPEKDIKKGTYKDIIDLIEKSRQNLAEAHVLHDKEYLHWRCAAVKPYREETLSLYTHAGSFILYYLTSKNCYLYEYHFLNEYERKILLRQLLNIASTYPSQALYTYANSLAEEKDLKEFGFFGFRTRLKVYAHTKDKNVDLGRKFHMNVYDSDGTI